MDSWSYNAAMDFARLGRFHDIVGSGITLACPFCDDLNHMDMVLHYCVGPIGVHSKCYKEHSKTRDSRKRCGKCNCSATMCHELLTRFKGSPLSINYKLLRAWYDYKNPCLNMYPASTFGFPRTIDGTTRDFYEGFQFSSRDKVTFAQVDELRSAIDDFYARLPTEFPSTSQKFKIPLYELMKRVTELTDDLRSWHYLENLPSEEASILNHCVNSKLYKEQRPELPDLDLPLDNLGLSDPDSASKSSPSQSLLQGAETTPKKLRRQPSILELTPTENPPRMEPRTPVKAKVGPKIVDKCTCRRKITFYKSGKEVLPPKDFQQYYSTNTIPETEIDRIRASTNTIPETEIENIRASTDCLTMDSEDSTSTIIYPTAGYPSGKVKDIESKIYNSEPIIIDLENHSAHASDVDYETDSSHASDVDSEAGEILRRFGLNPDSYTTANYTTSNREDLYSNAPVDRGDGNNSYFS